MEQQILANTNINSATELKGNKFGYDKSSIFGKNFKIRITSKSSKKKIDINLVYNKTIDTTKVVEQLKKQVEQSSKKIKA
jgi:hypothetical protein